jgi:hypothetical protein
MKKMIVTVAVVAMAVGSAVGGSVTQVTEKAVAPGIKIVEAEIKMAAGTFNVTKGTPEKDVAATLDGDYDKDRFEYDYSFDHSGSRGDLFFESKLLNRLHANIDGEYNRWDFSFSPDVDLRLNTDIGAAKADLDLGGLAVSELKLDVGAAEATVDFSEPNKTALNLFKVSAGACKLRMNNLGNSRFDRLEFEGGVGSFYLDFSGDFNYRAEARIEVGLGSVEITIPSEVGVRLESNESFLSSVDFPKSSLRRLDDDEDVYESDNFQTAKAQLVIRLDVGMGSAKIRFR